MKRKKHLSFFLVRIQQRFGNNLIYEHEELFYDLYYDCYAIIYGAIPEVANSLDDVLLGEQSG